MKGISVCSLTFLIILAIPLVAVSVANEEPPINHPQNPNRNLFSEVEVQGDVPIPDDPTIVRTRLVNINFDLLGNTALPAKTVRLNLFDSVVFTAVFDRTETNSLGSYAWIGHLEGIEFGQAVLVVTHGLLAGSVSMPGAIYQIHSIGKGAQVIDEIDQSTFPPEMDPIPVPPTEGNPFDDPEADDACNEISVLVAYTPAARAADGGTAAIEARIALAVSETNQSYVNSGLTQRINLVHVMETNPGDATNNFSADLSALQNTTDGIFDNVDAARETHYADMVGLIIENSSSCGLGYLNSTAGWAFSVTHRTCTTGYYSFGHELGHNMSARHDWYIDNSLNSPYSYSKAFVYINDPTRWRTIMAYNSLCNDTSPNTYCTRLQYWSNPNVFYGGISMGVQSDGPTNCVAGFTTPHPSTCAADNRMALNNTCSSVANFRQSPPTTPDKFPWILFYPAIMKGS